MAQDSGHIEIGTHSWDHVHPSVTRVREYLPRQELVLGAFTTVPAPVTADSSIWQIPRFVCNHHWKSPDELLRLLSAAMA